MTVHGKKYRQVKEKVDPTGERGYVSGTFYDAAVVTRHGQMAVTEFAVTNL